MKENNRSQKFTQKKNILPTKKEIKLVNEILDLKKTNKSNASSNIKKNMQKPSPKKLEPIKVRLTPINRRYESKGKKTIKMIKESNFNSNKNSIINNSLYLSPPHMFGLDRGSASKLKIDKKKTFSENKSDLKDDKNSKINDRNCNTPFRKIVNDKSKDTFSPSTPSTSVIIKNFNYNNVYNINIDNEKDKNKKNNNITISDKKINNNTLTNYHKNDNKKINTSKNSNKDISQKFTYNKPKTTSGMNTPYILSKRNKSKDATFIKDNYIKEQNRPSNKSETVYSRFISEGNSLKNCRNNLHSSLMVAKMEKNQNQIQTPYRNKSINNFYMTTKSHISHFNLQAQEINNDINNTYSNHFSKNNSYSKLSFQKKEVCNFYNTSSLSLNNTFVNNRNLVNSPNLSDKYSNKTVNIQNKRYTNNDNDTHYINDFENNEIIFKLNDLYIFEDRINDIVSAFNKTNNIYDIEASNECNEFINFYSKSSLKGIFSIFFNDNNKLIIESSINLSILFISIIYHLSINNILFNDLISTINNILSLLKINFALYIKKIQLYYGIDIVRKNFIYFQPFNSFLSNNNIKDIEEEDDITYKIYQNCRTMTNEIKTIMNYYQRIDLNSYEYFTQIFNNISIQKEEDLLKYFYNKNNNMNYSQNPITVNKSNINFNNTLGGTLKKNRTNLSLGNFSQYKKDFEKVLIKLPEKIYQKSPIRSINKENYKKNKIEIPYIRTPSDKKYTLVLDLNKTLAFYNKYTNNVSLRNGLFSFLSMMKPYYELISFSCEPNEITESIIKDIESQKIYFDYHLTREHSILYENTLVKDISLIGRDDSKIIIIDDDENCFKLNTENGIRISEYVGNNEFDNALFELKKILLLIYKNNYDDIRVGIKEFSNEIRNKVSFV